MSLPTLPDLKAHLDIPNDNNDDELQATLDRAVAVLERRVGPLAVVTVTDEVHTGPGPLLLKRYPVASVTSATSSGVAVTDLDADLDAGVLHGTFGSLSRSVRVTYTTGRADLPADLEAAVLELAGHLWQSQRGTSPSALALQQSPEEFSPTPSGGYLLPYRVQSLIEPYLLPTVA